MRTLPNRSTFTAWQTPFAESTFTTASDRVIVVHAHLTGDYMNARHASRWPRQYLTGLTLIAIGAAFLLDQLGIVQLYDLWHFWPLALVVIGAVRIIDTPTARGVSSGLWTMFIGAWLYGNFEGWFGMDFSNSWPFLLIAWGVILVLLPRARKRLDAPSHAGRLDREEQRDAR